MRVLLMAPLFLSIALTAQAADKPVTGKPNPDAAEKASPLEAAAGKASADPAVKGARKTANEGDRPLVGEPVELDEALKLLNKLAAYKGKVEGGKAETIRRDVAALLAGNNAYRVDAIGCDKLNPLTDKNGRVQIMECTLQYSRVSKQSDTRIEMNFGTDGWYASTAKIKDAVFRVLSE